MPVALVLLYLNLCIFKKPCRPDTSIKMRRTSFKSKGPKRLMFEKAFGDGAHDLQTGLALSGKDLRLPERGLDRCTLVHLESGKTGPPVYHRLEKTSLELTEDASHIDWIPGCPKPDVQINHCYIYNL